MLFVKHLPSVGQCWFWVVLVGFVGFVAGFGSFWLVLGGFGWFRVLVTT